jgi:hypothetical protein
MDIFDVLANILKRKKIFMCSGISELEALVKAEQDVSEEYHISLSDIKKLVGQIFNNTEVYKGNNSIVISKLS